MIDNMKLTKEEIYTTIECLQLVNNPKLIELETEQKLPGIIWKLQHQLKHLEDKELSKKEEYKIFGDYNPVEEFQKVINSVKK